MQYHSLYCSLPFIILLFVNLLSSCWEIQPSDTLSPLSLHQTEERSTEGRHITPFTAPCPSLSFSSWICCLHAGKLSQETIPSPFPCIRQREAFYRGTQYHSFLLLFLHHPSYHECFLRPERSILETLNLSLRPSPAASCLFSFLLSTFFSVWLFSVSCYTGLSGFSSMLREGSYKATNLLYVSCLPLVFWPFSIILLLCTSPSILYYLWFFPNLCWKIDYRDAPPTSMSVFSFIF